MTKSTRIKLDLGEKNGAVTFKSIEEFPEWLQSEKAQWQWLGKNAQNRQTVGQLWQLMNKHWQGMEKSYANYTSGPEQHKENHRKAFFRSVETAYGQNELILSSSPRGNYIREIAESNSALAASVACFFIGLGAPQNDPVALEGAFRALQFDFGIVSNIEAEQKSLTNLQVKWQTELTDLSSQFDDLVSDTKQQHHDLEELKSGQVSQFEDFLSEANKSKEAIEQTYREHMALKAPVEYWSNKATLHQQRSTTFGKVALACGGGVAVLLAVATWVLLIGVEKPDYWRLAVLGLFTALGVWLVRIVIRLFLSNMHQASDAEERVTMVETFLSLMSEGHISREEDRHLVLQALFRSAQTGLVKDEGSPPTVIDISNKLFKDKP